MVQTADASPGHRASELFEVTHGEDFVAVGVPPAAKRGSSRHDLTSPFVSILVATLVATRFVLRLLWRVLVSLGVFLGS